MQKFKVIYAMFPADAEAIAGITQQRKGYCLIVINSMFSAEEQAATLRHELAHIALDHFAITAHNLQRIETEADKYAESMTQTEFDELMKWQIPLA